MLVPLHKTNASVYRSRILAVLLHLTISECVSNKYSMNKLSVEQLYLRQLTQSSFCLHAINLYFDVPWLMWCLGVSLTPHLPDKTSWSPRVRMVNRLMAMFNELKLIYFLFFALNIQLCQVRRRLRFDWVTSSVRYVDSRSLLFHILKGNEQTTGKLVLLMASRFIISQSMRSWLSNLLSNHYFNSSLRGPSQFWLNGFSPFQSR
jgi:hypothetical protein